MPITHERAKELMAGIDNNLSIDTKNSDAVFEVFSAFAKMDAIVINERIDTVMEIDDYFPEEGLTMDDAEHKVFTDSFYDFLAKKTAGIKHSLDCNSEVWLNDTAEKMAKIIIHKMQIRIASDSSNPGGVAEFLRQIDHGKYNAEVKLHLEESLNHMRASIESHVADVDMEEEAGMGQAI